MPQGSFLGPLLFLIYIKNLEVNIRSKIKFFADVTMLFSVVRHPSISVSELNDELSFNPEYNKQAVEVLFSKKIKTGSSSILLQWNRGYQS